MLHFMVCYHNFTVQHITIPHFAFLVYRLCNVFNDSSKRIAAAVNMNLLQLVKVLFSAEKRISMKNRLFVFIDF